MSKRHPTIGCKGKPAVERPPKPIQAVINCECGHAATIPLTIGTTEIIYPCPDCGALLCYYIENFSIRKATIEQVES